MFVLTWLAMDTGTSRLCNQLENASETCGLGASNRRFIPENRLRDLMTAPRIKEELRIELRWRFPLLNNQFINGLHSTSPKVFAVLAITRLIKCARGLQREGLGDSHLPLSRMDPGQDILMSASGEQFNTFVHHAGSARLFLEKQWQVLAPVLDASGSHIALDENCALPVVEVDPEGRRGGASSVCKGTIHEAHFNGFKVRQEDDLNIAIKELEPTEEQSASEVFMKERENLDEIRSLTSHQHLIRAIATCQVHNKYYILFPWADGGDLDEFWKRHKNGSRPGDAALVLWSLKQMEGLVDALRLMHGINHRHGDLKPGNILHFPRGNPFDRQPGETEGTLVIADYGVSKRHEQATQMRRDGTNTRATTRSYEAPEADGSQTDPRSRRYDLWSVGCIMLEYVVWLLHGYDAVTGFQSQRIARGKLTSGYASFYVTGDDEERNGQKLNVAVEDAVAAILEDPRCTGSTALGDLVALIPKCLLLIDAAERDTAEELHRKLATIVSKAKDDGSYLFRKVSPQPDTPSVFSYNWRRRERKIRTVDDMPP
ncbi:hypothetical protein ACJZ2D_004840 [Fusarium nematophilum]